MPYQSFTDAPAAACSLPLDQPCPHAQLEVMRQTVSVPYRHAAMQVSFWKLAAYNAQQERKISPNPFKKLSALFDELGARFELRSATAYKAALLPNLPHEIVAARLGWESDHILSPCAHHHAHEKNAILPHFFRPDQPCQLRTPASFPIPVRTAQSEPKPTCTCSHSPKQGVA